MELNTSDYYVKGMAIGYVVYRPQIRGCSWELLHEKGERTYAIIAKEDDKFDSEEILIEESEDAINRNFWDNISIDQRILQAWDFIRYKLMD